MLHLLGPALVAGLHGSLHLAALANPFADLFHGLVTIVAGALDWIYRLTRNYGWSMLLLALGISLLVLPLSLQSLKSMTEMQALAPYLKRLQAKYKNDRQKMTEEQMKLYREHGVNPLGGCLPMLAQYPFLLAVFYAIRDHNTAFATANWLWIGSGLSHKFPQILATSLAQSDLVLLVGYAVSMYFSMKLTPTVSADPQQAQMMRTQAIIMPVMLLFFGYRLHWSSAFVLYWLAFNVISMAERWWVMRLPSRIPKMPEETAATLAGYPRECPNCKQQLTVVKGSKCENCGAKVKRVSSDNGVQQAKASGDGAPSGGKTPGKGAKKSS